MVDTVLLRLPRSRKTMTSLFFIFCIFHVTVKGVPPKNLRHPYSSQHLSSLAHLPSSFDPHQSAALFSSAFYDAARQKISIGKTLENCPVLVLNADFQVLCHEPLSVWNWQDALKAVMSDKAMVVSEYDLLIRSVSTSLLLPSVIALKQFHRKGDKPPMMSRKYLLLRDSYTCQYCLKRYPPDQLSMDHVNPRAGGGRLTWDNTVCACISCNSKKGSTPLEDIERKLGMRLAKKPHIPSVSELQNKARKLKQRARSSHPHWSDYL
jgi:5-methylcytosine-specific restriction endonuclease McrA